MTAFTTRAALAALVGALAAVSIGPGLATAKPRGKPPVSAVPPPGRLTKTIYLSCHHIATKIAGTKYWQHKIRVTNNLGYKLPAGTKIIWRRKGGRTSVGGIITLRPYGLRAGHNVERNVTGYLTGCRAWINASATQ